MMPGGRGGGGECDGFGGGCGGAGGVNGGGGVDLRALLPTPAVATADAAPERTESFRRLPSGLFIVDSGGPALRDSNAIDSVTATATTADAAIITATATATVDSGAGTVPDLLPEKGSFATPEGTSAVVGDADESVRGGCNADSGSNGADGDGGGSGYVATALAAPSQLHPVGEERGGRRGERRGGWGGGERQEAYSSPPRKRTWMGRRRKRRRRRRRR